MQTAVATAVESGENVFVTSPTGSGKTLAFLLPIIHLLENQQVPSPFSCLVLLPTRELAQQSVEVFKKYATSSVAEVLHGGRPVAEERNRMTCNAPDVIFATPGRLLDHLQQDTTLLSNLRHVVVDEYDKCLDLGFKSSLENIVNYLPKRGLQYVFTSATPLYQEALHLFSLDERQVVFLDYSEDHIANLHQYYVNVSDDDVANLSILVRLLLQVPFKSCIVFATHKEEVELIARCLRKYHFDAVAYHGGLTQEQRERAVFKFSSQCAIILVATDIAARGLDFPQVDMVVHFHLPTDVKGYLHRVGRSLRWENHGCSFLFLPSDNLLPDYLHDIERYEVCLGADSDVVVGDAVEYAAPFMALYIGRGKKEGISRGDVLGFLCQNAMIDKFEVGKIQVFAHFSLVALPVKKIDAVLERIKGKKIKKQQTVFEKLRN